MEYSFLASKDQPRSIKRMKTSVAVQTHQKQWFKELHERAKQGEPVVFANFMSPHELLEAMDINVIVNSWWFALVSAKRTSALYNDLVAEKGHTFCPYSSSVVLGEALDHNPKRSPWGGLPKLTAIIEANEPCWSQARIGELWAREQNCPVFRLENTATPPFYPRYQNWWEKITDRWDEVIEPYRLDYRVEELKSLIKFLEIITGKKLNQQRLEEAMELANEQNLYWRKSRDLIAKTSPSPIDAVDQLACYAMQWHRGKKVGRDLAKMFYEEIKDKVEKGEAAYPNEKIRLQWVKAGLFGNTSFYQFFAETYGAVFVVCTWYLSTAADGYPRSLLGDPLRALASRHLFLGLYSGPYWDIKDARLFNVNGAMVMSAECRFGAGGLHRELCRQAYEAAGIPILMIQSSWNAEQTRAEVSNFIEKRLLLQ